MRLIAIAFLLLTPSIVQGQNTDWTEPIDPFAIGDDLYYVGTAGLSAYLLTSEEGHILIDAPLQENVPLVLDNIRELGFSPSDVRIQLTSHAHFDHVGGLADMLEATGADLVVSAEDGEYIRRGADFGLETAGYPSASPARTVSHLETVRLGDLELTAHLTPGHTPGCTTWSGSVEIEGAAYTFVSVCSLSVLSMYRIVGEEPTYAGQAEDYCRSVAHLRTLDPDIFLGAHGSWFGLDEKVAALRAGDSQAFIANERYGSYLDSAEERIEEVLAEQGHSGGCASLAQ